MSFLFNIKQESGYTLLETVVAMALFLGVTIPIGVTIGNLILDRSAGRTSLAMDIAQTEFCRVISERDFSNNITKDNRGFMIERKVARNGKMVDVNVIVYEARQARKKIFALHKTMLVYQ